MSEAKVRAAFRDQVRFCTNSGTPLTAAVLAAAEAALDRTTATGRRILDWPGDARGSGDSVPLRLAGGFHALARAGVDPALSALYAGAFDTAGAVIPDILRRFDAALEPWLDSPPQTNETGRAAAIMAALLVLADRFALPFDLIELGCSAGLNLNLDRFSYRLGDTEAGLPGAALRLEPAWTGGSPPSAEVRVVARRGVDQAPIDVADPAQRDRLIAYVWPDQADRMARIAAALAIAADHPPPVTRGDAADYAEAELARPQRDGVTRVLFHTIHWTYLPPDKQARIEAALARAGAGASDTRPLAWARFELTGEGGVAGLWLTSWPGGETVRLATGHPHVKSLRWEV